MVIFNEEQTHDKSGSSPIVWKIEGINTSSPRSAGHWNLPAKGLSNGRDFTMTAFKNPVTDTNNSCDFVSKGHNTYAKELLVLGEGL